MSTVFPALAFPSFHTIATGKYPKHHHIKGKYYMSPEQKISGYGQEMFSASKEIPIWILNQMNGGISGCMMWPGSEFVYNKTKCTYIQKYDRNITFKQRVDTVIEWMNKTNIEEQANLVMFYVETLDQISHMTGPQSRNTTVMIKKIDLLTNYIMRQLKEINVYYKTNIIIISDHGTLPVLGKNLLPVAKTVPQYKNATVNFIYDDVYVEYVVLFEDQHSLDKFANSTRIFYEKFLENNHSLVTVPHFIINKSAAEYQLMEGFAFKNLFRKRYKKGWFPEYSVLNKENLESVYGVHGYNRQNDGIFMAKGPSFLSFKKVEPFQMVDFYCAFAKLLRIRGDYQKDGNYMRILPIFIIQRTMSWPGQILFIITLSVISTSLFYLFVNYVK